MLVGKLMRICMISGLTSPPGGLEVVVDELSKFLTHKDVDVTLFGRDEFNFDIKTTSGKIVGIKPLNYLPQPLHFQHYDKYAYSFEVWKKIKEIQRFDIIHGHGDNCFFPSLFRGKTPFIMTFHGTMAKAIRASENRHLGPRIMPILYTEKTAALRCDMAIACSIAVKNELVTFYGISPHKIRVIHNGVNVNTFKPHNKKKARNLLGLPEKRKYAIWVGTNPRLKGLSIAIKTIKSLKDISLIVVGISGTNSENVLFFGKIKERQLLCLLYNAADFLIFPTLYEGFPLVPLEALACSLPIIVSEESNLGEIINEGVHGFVINDRNPLSYKEKIELLLNDSRMLNDMSVQCRNLAVNYSWKKQAEKYWKIYNLLIARG